MEVKDLLVTPIVLAFVYFMAYMVRPYVTDRINKPYFIPALTLKIIGGISLGLIYQFYYGGGDTFTYFNLGSKYIWQAFLDSPAKGVQLILVGKEYSPETFSYASKIYTYGDTSSYFIVRIAGIFDLLTYHTYSATSVLFSALSFTGIWVLYLTFYKLYPEGIVAENRPGGSGAKGWGFLFAQKGDPYHISTTSGSFITTPLQANTPWQPGSFTPIALLATDDMLMLVNKGNKATSLKEFIAAAKAKPPSIGASSANDTPAIASS